MKRLSREVRAAFLEFWRKRDHRVVKSSPLIPKGDPTLLFTSAGMVPFKSLYASTEPLEYRRATSVQKCLRATDLEDVGHTPRHCTFFEMLGHFSFGDYFKREAILWNWEFFTKVCPLPTERLRASVFEQDEEAYAIWRDEVGLPEDWIFRLGREDNFWGPAGETGACGPSSELYFDLGEELGCGAAGCAPGCDCDRWIEVGNFVFPQYDRQPDGSDLPLPNRGIDTGIGLERLTMVLAGKKSIFETDLFAPLIGKIGALGAGAYDGERKSAYHVVADHTRALTFALTEGILPANEGRGYVIRRLLRRAAVQGHRLGLREPFIYRLMDTVVEEMGPAYPELGEASDSVRVALRSEEERFQTTLEQGLSRFEETAGARSEGEEISGRDLFVLYDTFGFPPDLTAMLAAERGLTVDLVGFEREMDRQRERSRSRSTFYRPSEEGLEWIQMSDGDHSHFIGYGTLEAETSVRRVSQIPGAEAEWWAVLESTPAYAESGGQVGDVGAIEGPGFRGEVLDTVAVGSEIRHRVRLRSGSWSAGPVRVRIDRHAREATQRNHTATHLLHAALRSLLGRHVTQAGSLVGPGRLRFDFTHTGPISEEQIDDIERLVNEQIMADQEVQVRFSSYDDAIRDGVMALFGEKYEEHVRRIGIERFSEELCGGTHVGRTGQIGSFLILSEAGIAAGVRRIEAITGAGAVEARVREKRALDAIRRQLQGAAEDLPGRLQQLIDENQRLRKENALLRTRGATDELSGLWEKMISRPGGNLLVEEITLGSMDGIRELGDRVRQRLGRGVALLAIQCGRKRTLLAVVTEDLASEGSLRADEIVREAAALVGGSGGGRAHLAMAGIPDPGRLPEVMEKMGKQLEAALGRLAG